MPQSTGGAVDARDDRVEHQPDKTRPHQRVAPVCPCGHVSHFARQSGSTLSDAMGHPFGCWSSDRSARSRPLNYRATRFGARSTTRRHSSSRSACDAHKDVCSNLPQCLLTGRHGLLRFDLRHGRNTTRDKLRSREPAMVISAFCLFTDSCQLAVSLAFWQRQEL